MKYFFYKCGRSFVAHWGLCLLGAMVLLLTASPAMPADGKNAEPQKTTAAVPASVAPGAIPTAEIIVRATDVSNYLLSLTSKFSVGAEVDTIKTQLPALMSQIYAELAHTEKLLDQHPTLTTLQSQQERWKQLNSDTEGWLEVLTKRSNGLQKELDGLVEIKRRWEMTLSSARAAKAPDSIVQQVEATLSAISAAQSPLRDQLTAMLDLQARLAVAIARCNATSGQIDEVQMKAMSGLLLRNRAQLISLDSWAGVLAELPVHAGDLTAAYWASLVNYSNDPSRHMTLHIGLLTLLTLLFIAARRRSRQWVRSQQTASPAVEIFNHPYAAALLVAILYIASQYSPVNAQVKQLAQVVVLLPMIMLIRPLIDKRVVSIIYVLGLLFVFDALAEIFAGNPLISQAVFVLTVLASVIVVIWFWWHLWTVGRKGSKIPHRRYFRVGAGIGLLILICGLIAAMLGYMRLARVLVPGILGGAVLALSTYATLLVVYGMVIFLLHVWPLSGLRLVEHHRAQLEGKIYRILLIFAILLWGSRCLNYLGLLGMAQSFVHGLLDAKFERGAFSISVGNVLEFFFIVWASYILSAFIRSVLREDVYSRLGISTGKSYADLSLMHYFIITLGFIAAIAALGVNLTKLTVMTGALGVGIGFGLQSVVNNFVSGLILLLERPIHVGDTVEVGNLLGKVRRIGIRASTVHTRQGADIIVPNSQLITENVTNWTLSDMLRRIDLPVGVSYSSVPKEVIKVLERVAIDHHKILADPPPQALFMGFGDSSINFELRAWTDQFDDWVLIRSELAVAVFDAVIAAGMTFPFPQREVRLLKDPGRDSETPPVSPDSKT